MTGQNIEDLLGVHALLLSVCADPWPSFALVEVMARTLITNRRGTNLAKHRCMVHFSTITLDSVNSTLLSRIRELVK